MEALVGLKPSVGDTNLKDVVEKHSPDQVMSHQELHYGDLLSVKEKGIPRKLVRVIGVDFLNEKVVVEWIAGLTLLTAGLEFSEYSLNGYHGENWLEKVSSKVKEKIFWAQRRIAIPFDPESIVPDYFP
jgi:hypothetical protein